MPARSYPDTLIVKLRDADTLEVIVDLGFKVSVKVTVRLAHVDCPEKATDAGKAALEFTSGWVASNGPLFQLTTYSTRDRYGRHLARVVSATGGDLAESLVAAGHGLYWNGRGKRPSR